MASQSDVLAISRLDGVSEVTLCSLDGTVLTSSNKRPELDAAAVSLYGSAQALQAVLPALGSPLTLTMDAEDGTVHLARVDDALLIVGAGADANLGAIRLGIRSALAE